jgi:hypothetical protein
LHVLGTFAGWVEPPHVEPLMIELITSLDTRWLLLAIIVAQWMVWYALDLRLLDMSQRQHNLRKELVEAMERATSVLENIENNTSRTADDVDSIDGRLKERFPTNREIERDMKWNR